jgi:predicted amidohydrolase
MGIQVVIGQLEIGWDPAVNSERVISFLRAETRPGCLAVLPEAALSGYDDELSGLDRLDARALAAGRCCPSRAGGAMPRSTSARPACAGPIAR